MQRFQTILQSTFGLQRFTEAAISMALYFLSLYCDLRKLRVSRVQSWLLQLASIGALNWKRAGV
jgi:hypothetical protein